MTALLLLFLLLLLLLLLWQFMVIIIMIYHLLDRLNVQFDDVLRRVPKKVSCIVLREKVVMGYAHIHVHVPCRQRARSRCGAESAGSQGQGNKVPRSRAPGHDFGEFHVGLCHLDDAVVERLDRHDVIIRMDELQRENGIVIKTDHYFQRWFLRESKKRVSSFVRSFVPRAKNNFESLFRPRL